MAMGTSRSVVPLLVTQATSPYFAPEAYWCIEETLTETFGEHDGFVYPYHVNVPSFGEWGFVMASKRGLDWSDKSLPIDTKFLTTERLPTLFVFGQDIAKERVDVKSNHLLDPVLFHYYKRGWSRYNQ